MDGRFSREKARYTEEKWYCCILSDMIKCGRGDKISWFRESGDFVTFF